MIVFTDIAGKHLLIAPRAAEFRFVDLDLSNAESLVALMPQMNVVSFDDSKQALAFASEQAQKDMHILPTALELVLRACKKRPKK